MTMVPPDPITAVTPPDPYPYYRKLVEQKPVYRDETRNLWVVASAAAVSAVLTSDFGRVRPLMEPVPGVLLGSPAATIFQHLVRMNDGERHAALKQAVSATIRSIERDVAAEESRRWARLLLDEMDPKDNGRLQSFAFRLPVYVIASLLGVSQERLEQVALWMSNFVYCLAPSSSLEQIEQGKLAAGCLLDLFGSLLDNHGAEAAGNLLMVLAEEMKRAGFEEPEVAVANGIGFLSQSYEATAGLIGNTVVTLASHRSLLAQVKTDAELLDQVIQEVLRYDAPVQNTRRFVGCPGSVAGEAMQEGDAVLVVLAAANHDAAVNPHPEHFDISRIDRHLFSFGAGAHACPGDMLACEIALAGVEQLLASGFDAEALLKTLSYRPSANVRLALLASDGVR
jgi:cytochrome P450